MTKTCECGCGQLTQVAASSNRIYARGEHRRFVRGHGPMPPLRSQTANEVVQRRVAAALPGDCWPWTGGYDEHGYGVASVGGRRRRAHRIAYELANGPIPDGLHVLHSCDNPPCCNPAHLSVGTNQDNVQEKVERGRQQRGERAPQSRLTERDVQSARARAAAGESVRAMAREFGVAQSTLQRAVNGATWKHMAATS